MVPDLGPNPSMYDPRWSTPKTTSAVAEPAGALLAVVGVVVATRRRR